MNRRYRKTVIAGNWKMNMTASETKKFAEDIRKIMPRAKWCETLLCVPAFASGSQGNIEMMVGVDGEGAVTGVSLVDNAETAGIGSKVMTNMPTASGVGVLSQFEGKSAADGLLAVGTNVDAISGATVSTRGVTNGVNAALAVAGAIG